MFKALTLALKHTDILLALFEIIRSIGNAIDSVKDNKPPNVAPLARKAFAMIPARYKAPIGSATEQEFVDFVYNGVSLFTKTK